jgi:hypothetical protein
MGLVFHGAPVLSSLGAYAGMSIMLSAVPFGMIAGVTFWLAKRAKGHRRD